MKNIKINVEGHRFLDDGKVCEDVTSVILPTLEHPTTPIENVPGMAMDMEIPNTTRYKAATYTVAHNNGNNCHLLQRPGVHKQEFRVARQDYANAKTEIGYESVKYRLVGLYQKTEKGTIQTGNPWGSNAVYGLKRYEEIINGTQTMIVDATGGLLTVNGKNYVDDIEKLLK